MGWLNACRWVTSRRLVGRWRTCRWVGGRFSVVGILSVEVVAIQKYSMENFEGAQKKCLMEITKSHCRFLVFVYLSGELY